MLHFIFVFLTPAHFLTFMALLEDVRPIMFLVVCVSLELTKWTHFNQNLSKQSLDVHLQEVINFWNKSNLIWLPQLSNLKGIILNLLILQILS